MEEKEIKFKDLLELQAKFDEEASKPRPNGFIPRHRYRDDILLSMIAEIIEFNEQTRDTHKTWKLKEDFDREKMLIEAVDILFFYLQLVNYYEPEKYAIESLEQTWNKLWKADDFLCSDNEVELIKSIVFPNSQYVFPGLINILMTLISMYREKGFYKDQIIKAFISKRERNLKRIDDEWSRGNDR
jgi:dimeric dUTPase (all-alpha-NTP-PPase superfamily)